MADKRTVDELSIDELERALRLKKMEARRERLRRLASQGRVVDGVIPFGELDYPRAAPSRPVETRAPASEFRSPRVRPIGERVPDPGAEQKKRRRRSHAGSIRDASLLLVEVLALVGLVVVLTMSYLNLRELNNEVVTARSDPTPTPEVAPTATPLIGVSRLPGGHSPPTSSGESTPDVPLHLQSWVQPPPAVPMPTPDVSLPTRIVIPSIGVDAPIAHGIGWEDLKKGVGHLPGSARPGERGNMYLAAHNDIYGQIFRDLEDLQIGDEFFVYAGSEPFRYVVTEKRIIEPTDVSVMYPTTEAVATLQTCYPYLVDTHRLVVIGELAD